MKFLVTQTGFNIALNFSGPANEWYDTFQPYFSYSQTIRQWFSKNVLLKHPERISQYLLECPSAEVRS